jgi:PAS domain-containing protein
MFEWIWKQILNLIPWAKIGEFLEDLIKHQKGALAIAVTLLAGSIGLGAWYWKRSGDYDDIVRNTLSANMEETPQTFKGLEAFIYSNLNQNIDETKNVNNTLEHYDLTQEFTTQLSNVQRDLDRFLDEATQKREIENVQIRVANGGNEGKVLTDSDESRPGFLFLPVYLLRATLGEEDFQSLKNRTLPNRIKQEIDADTNLKRDVALTGFLAKELQEFTKKPIFKFGKNDPLLKFVNNQPTQVYVITKNGVNRIFSNKGQEFWGKNLMPPKSQTTVGQYFSVTRPYLDLAGNGIVITLSRGLIVDGMVQAVLCFDLQFVPSNSIDTSLRQRIAKLEGTSVQVICEVFEAGNVTCAPDTRAEHAPPSDVQNDLILEVVNYMKDSPSRERAKVTGNIRVINENSNGSELHFSVPIAEAGFGVNQQSTTLLLVSLDVIKYKRFTSFIAAAASFSLGLVVLLLTYFWARTMRSKKEYEESLEQVGRVMFKSPTPYVRLRADDYIHDCSLSFCEKLGYPPIAESVRLLKQRRFQDLIDDDDKHLKTYHDVQELRRSKRPVTPYTLRMRRRDESTVDVVVRSAAVPSRESGMPETFGILLDVKEDHNPSRPETDNAQEKLGANL